VAMKRNENLPGVTTEVVYRSAGHDDLRVVTDGETVWLTQEQMCLLFGRNQSVIARHIGNVFREGELPKEGFMQILHKTSGVGGRPVALYNLDVVISVGYRVKSFQGTRFRQWATRVLREMLLRRVEEMKGIDKLTRRVAKVESDVEQIKGGMGYLVKQLTAPNDPPRRRIGFGASEDDVADKPYGRI